MKTAKDTSGAFDTGQGAGRLIVPSGSSHIMNNNGNRAWRFLAAVFAFLVAETVTFYAYSLVWLAEGQPQRAGDPTLKALTWVCLVAMVAWLVALLYSIGRTFRSPARCTQPPDQS